MADNYGYDYFFPSGGHEIQPAHHEGLAEETQPTNGEGLAEEMQPTEDLGLDTCENDRIDSYQRAWKIYNKDNETGNYTSVGRKVVASRGETIKERATGRFGYKNELKTTSTYKVGDTNGYMEYEISEKYRQVNFDSSLSSSSKGKISFSAIKKFLK